MQHIAATLAFIAVLMAALLWQQHLPAVRLQRNSSPPPLLSRVCQHSGQQRTPQFSGLKTNLVAVPIHAGHYTGPSSGDSSGDSSAGPGSSQQPGKATKQQRGPLQSLILQTVLLSRIVGTLLLLIAAAPYLISSRLGTAAAAAAASRVLPGDVRIQRISLGWTQPVALYGLTVFEGEAGSSRQLIALQRFSSAGVWQGGHTGRITYCIRESGGVLSLHEPQQPTPSVYCKSHAPCSVWAVLAPDKSKPL
jgi:hypothetical protein